MRKYLWMATMISVTTVYVYADDNPFNLKENLQKIDRDQDFLLSAFQDIVDKKEKLDELNLDESDEVLVIDKDEKIINDLNVSSEDIDTVKVVVERNISKDKSVEKENKQIVKKEEKEEKIKQEKLRDKKEKEELKRLEKVKLEQLKIEEERKKQEKEKQEKVKKDKLEALRIEKLKKEKEKIEEKEKLEKEKEKLEAKQKKIEVKKVSKLENPKQVKQKVEIEQLSSEAIVDINITQEKLIATEEADKVYLEAIKEMDED